MGSATTWHDMIDLKRTRTELLSQIDSPLTTAPPLDDLTDPAVAHANTCIRIRGHGRDDLFPLLHAALSERFVDAPRSELIQDLLIPLRNAIGNADKHGNAQDPAKLISVELVLTTKGVFIGISDQGAGFDVALTFRRFQEQEQYFVNHGCGFCNLHRAKSIIAYEDGGRTLLLCFQPERPLLTRQRAPKLGAVGPSSSWWWGAKQAHSLNINENSEKFCPKFLDPEWIMARLSALPEFATDQSKLVSCRVYTTGANRPGSCEMRYVLGVKPQRSNTPEPHTRVLTGRLHLTAAVATADFEAATKVYEVKHPKGVLIPKPLLQAPSEGRLVLYQFDPWMNFWEHLSCESNAIRLRHSAKLIGRALADLHSSPAMLPAAENYYNQAHLRARIVNAAANLQGSHRIPDGLKRLHACTAHLDHWPPSQQPQCKVPIHGSFGWDSIRYGVDGNFYFDHFENAGHSDPRVDLAGFAADLLCFSLAHYDEPTFRLCQDAMLRKYNSRAEYPIAEGGLGWFIALALLERLGRPELHVPVSTEQLLNALEVTLRTSF